MSGTSASGFTTSPLFTTSPTLRPTGTLSHALSGTTSGTAHHPSHTTTPESTNTSSPLLFFVALGFGVVFTNLWIIVGVKYCFRYNARNRQLREAAENGEPIDLAAMGGRPHRRRREKKLMSMEEVNERFPLVKYKIWRATREHEGLPAAGGVTSPPSRAGSVKNAEGLARALQSETSGTSTTSDSPTKHAPEDAQDFAARNSALEHEPQGLQNVDLSNDVPRPTVEDAEDEDDPIRTAVPTELLAHPGDACAICIDNLDDDDEVRGLTCGHAFHAGCLDPWLTSRRACCPLCKADYFVPKPRPEGEPAADPNFSRRAGSSMPDTTPLNIWLGVRASAPSRQRQSMNGRSVVMANLNRYGLPTVARRTTNDAPTSQASRVDATAATDEAPIPATAAPTWRERMTTPFHHSYAATRPRMPGFLRRNNASATAEEPAMTPGQLEAGARES